jgi:phage-related protein
MTQASGGFSKVGAEATKATTNVNGFAKAYGTSYSKMPSELKEIARSMTNVTAETQKMFQGMVTAWQEQDKAQAGLKQKLMENRIGWLQLTQGAKTYQGTNAQFMAQVVALGAAQKAIQDQMRAANDMAKASFIASVGSLLAMSTQSSKIAANYKSMANPLYQANTPLLAMSGALERVARGGTASALALKQLGPTASMKELQDRTGLINQGLTRFGAVAATAGIASVLLYGNMHKAAMGNQEYADSWNRMKDAINKALQPMRDVFTAVMPVVYNFITSIANLISKFNEAHPTIAKIVAAFMLLVPAITLILSPLAIGIGLIGGLQAAFAFLAPVIMPLVTGLAAMSGTVILVTAAIVALVAAGVALYQNWDTVKAYLISAWNAIKTASAATWTAITTALTTAWNAAKTATTTAWNAISSFFSTWWAGVKSRFSSDVSAVGSALSTGWNAIKTAAITAWNGIKDGIVNAFTAVKTGIVNVWNGIKAAFDNGVNIVKTVANNFLQFFMNYTPLGYVIKTIRANWDTIKQTFQILGDSVKAIWNLLWDAIKTAVEPKLTAIKNAITTAWNAIKTGTQTAFDAIKSVLTTVWNAIKSVVMPIVDALKTGITNAWNALKTATQTAFTAIKTALTTAWNAIKAAVMPIVEALKTAITNAWNSLKSTTTSVWNAIKSALTSAWNSIKSAVTSAANSVKSTVTNIWNSVKSTTSSVWNSIKSSLSSVWNSIKSTVSSAASNVLSSVKSKFNSAKTAITKPISDAYSKVKSTISQMVRAVTGISWKVPLPKVPHINVNVKWGGPGNKIPYPSFSVKWGAYGGILDGAQLIGAGERGKEMLMPLEGKYFKPVAGMIAEQMKALNVNMAGAGAGASISVPLVLNGREIARAVVPNLDKELERQRQIRKRGF